VIRFVARIRRDQFSVSEQRFPIAGKWSLKSICRCVAPIRKPLIMQLTKDWQVVDMVRQAIKDHRLVALRKGEDYGRNQDLPGDTGRIEARRCLLSLQASQGWRRVAQGLCRSRFLES